MSYARQNTVQIVAASPTADAAATLALPNGSTGALPSDQVGTINAISPDQRWRIQSVVAGYGETGTGLLTITDGIFTWEFPVTGTVPLPNLDLQCAGGAEVDITLAAVTGAIGYINVSVVSEG